MRISDWSSDVCSSDLFCADGGVAGRSPKADASGSGASGYGSKKRTCKSRRADFGGVTSAFEQGQRKRVRFQAREIGRAHVELQSLMRISYAVFCLKKKSTIDSHVYIYMIRLIPS